MCARALIIGSTSSESTSNTGVPHLRSISRNKSRRSAVGMDPRIARSNCSLFSSSNARVVLVAGETAYPACANVLLRAIPVRLSKEIDRILGKDK